MARRRRSAAAFLALEETCRVEGAQSLHQRRLFDPGGVVDDQHVAGDRVRRDLYDPVVPAKTLVDKRRRSRRALDAEELDSDPAVKRVHVRRGNTHIRLHFCP
jgi:hypothetical protein